MELGSACAVEVSGFYIPYQGTTRTIADPGKLDLNFINPPVGFEGDNGLWLQADVVRVQELFSLINGEVNFRVRSGVKKRSRVHGRALAAS